jgi:hypothetical protein
MNSELWHACAGPLVSLPQPGSLVFYFPQGHSEQVNYIPFSLLNFVLVFTGIENERDRWIIIYLANFNNRKQ